MAVLREPLPAAWDPNPVATLPELLPLASAEVPVATLLEALPDELLSSPDEMLLLPSPEALLEVPTAVLALDWPLPFAARPIAVLWLVLPLALAVEPNAVLPASPVAVPDALAFGPHAVFSTLPAAFAPPLPPAKLSHVNCAAAGVTDPHVQSTAMTASSAKWIEVEPTPRQRLASERKFMTAPKRRDTRVQHVALPRYFTRHAVADDAIKIPWGSAVSRPSQRQTATGRFPWTRANRIGELRSAHEKIVLARTELDNRELNAACGDCQSAGM
jgi:hypothetical protein